MRNAMVLVLVLVGVGYLGAQVAGVYAVRSELTRRVEHYLDFVDEKSQAQVKENLVKDARAKGVVLQPADIHIVYQDTGIRSVAQKMLEPKVATFRNKQVAIAVQYNARILGLRWRQEITCSKIKQVQAQRRDRQEWE
jgi:glycine/D-amino acid oxidase-like deaminating enzyme